MKFIFLDQDDTLLLQKYLNPLQEKGTVEVYNTIPESEEQILERARDADVIFFGTTKITSHTLDKLPTLKVLQFLGTGVWNLVDVEYAEKKGIKVLNIDGYGNNAVAEFTIALALSLARSIPWAVKKMERQKWDLEGLNRVEIQGSTFGVIGTGNIGAVVAKKASLLGAKVLAYDIYENEELKCKFNVCYTTLEDLIAEADFLTLHLKTNSDTKNIIDHNLISHMKRNSFLINTARADLVDNDALYDALKGKRIGGAALDVFYEEPPSDYRFTNLKNAITTPHIGYYTEKAVSNMFISSINSVLKAIER